MSLDLDQGRSIQEVHSLDTITCVLIAFRPNKERLRMSVHPTTPPSLIITQGFHLVKVGVLSDANYGGCLEVQNHVRLNLLYN